MKMRGDIKRKRSKLGKAAEALRKKAKDIHEYEVIRMPEERRPFLRDLVRETLIYESVYERTSRLKKQLVREFERTPLHRAIPGQEISNAYGSCYCIVDECFTQFKKAEYEKSKQLIMSNLKLVYGIGPVWETKLKQHGYHTIEDLKNHPRWQHPANELLKMIEINDVGSLQNWLWRYLPKSHPLAHYLAGFCKEEDFAILDIETLGLFGRPIILLGIARPRNNKICVNQFLLRDISDETGALWEFVSQFDENTALITFNGRAFDVPFIQERLSFYGMDASLDNPHFDLLHFTRRAWRDQLPNCRLETIEKYLGIHRDVDLPSALVPEFYETYLKTQNVGTLVAIVEHNKQDLLTLATLFSKLYETWNL